jgi:hypothetical protein
MSKVVAKNVKKLETNRNKLLEKKIHMDITLLEK